MNSHVGEESYGFPETHGGKGFRERNEDGQRLLESCESLDLALINTFFTEKDDHKITYSSSGCNTQIDYIMLRRSHIGRVRDCQVILGDDVVSQHRLLCAKMNFGKQMKTKIQ